MAYAGLEMFNPVTGQRTTFHRTARDTGGELLRLEWAGGAGWSAGPLHVHRKQEERFQVLDGVARSHVDGVEHLHGPGDVFVAPAGSVHTVANAGDADIRLLVEFRPALRSEDVLETLAALAREGRVKSDGAPSDLMDLALLVHDYEDEIHLASPPLALQRLVFGPIAWLGHRLRRPATRPYPVPATA
jgi:mannose-6-phosphate isomerase-like protein (cupin superfamily)